LKQSFTACRAPQKLIEIDNPRFIKIKILFNCVTDNAEALNMVLATQSTGAIFNNEIPTLMC